MGTRDVSQCFSAQHEQSVQDVSFASGRRPQLRTRHVQSAQHGRSGQDVSFASGRGHGSPLGMPPFALIPRWAGDEMWSDGLWKGWSGGIGYAARDMARQVKWEDPALRRE